jgi:prepilin signal peptidase PulO-like enzyme (type II secretory pathway)
MSLIFYVIAALYGVLLGNYMTSFYFRIPRGIPINGFSTKRGKAPHCSKCEHPLQVYEYLPVISWFTTLFKCNYCKQPIGYEYFLIEVSTMIGTCAFLHYLGTFDEIFALSAPIIALIVLNIALLLKRNSLFMKSTSLLVFYAAIVFYVY